MNRSLALVGLLFAFAAASEAMAGCGAVAGDSRIGNQGGIQGALGGKRINAVSPGGEDWKEDHCSGGDLYKVGNGSAVDPRAKRGTWSIVGTGNDRSVRYAYTGDANSPYTWTLWQNAGVLYFCSGGSEIAHTVSIGSAGTPCN
jgi:hypothetical protein